LAISQLPVILKAFCLRIKLKTGQPFYLRDLFHYNQLARTLRSIQSTATLSAGDKD